MRTRYPHHIKPAKQTPLVQHLRSLLTSGNDLYPTTLAETWGRSEATILAAIEELQREGLCIPQGFYYTYANNGTPVRHRWYEPTMQATMGPDPSYTAETPRLADEECARYTRLIGNRLAY